MCCSEMFAKWTVWNQIYRNRIIFPCVISEAWEDYFLWDFAENVEIPSKKLDNRYIWAAISNYCQGGKESSRGHRRRSVWNSVGCFLCFGRSELEQQKVPQFSGNEWSIIPSGVERPYYPIPRSQSMRRLFLVSLTRTSRNQNFAKMRKISLLSA